MENKEKNPSPSRREFLLKSGRYAAYASPVIVGMLMPRIGVYAQSGLGTSVGPPVAPAMAAPFSGEAPFGSESSSSSSGSGDAWAPIDPILGN